MCGIAGFWGNGSAGDLDRMTDALAHRGPDGRGVWIDPADPVFLGHRRLSIIDLDGGTQPMATPEGDLTITFNGEIYNHLDLRRELEALGHRFETDHSDTEVLLYAYRAWGEAMVDRLNGMWAFAIYDRPHRRLFLSRDRFGKKPLFYTSRRGFFAFASELSALARHPDVSTSVSERALQKYFAYGYIPAPHALYEGACKLPAGHSLTLDLREGLPRIRQFWDFRIEPFETVPRDAEQEWGEELLRLLRLSVKRRLMADVDLGIFLSGGIDSSMIAALAAQESSSKIRTFSIGFEESSFDESEYAELVARSIGSDHYSETLSMERSRELLPEIVARLDEPMGDSSLLPTYLVSGIARKRVTVALGGDGGDELFAGYDPFDALRKARLYRSLVPKPVHQAILFAAARLPVSHRNMSLDFKLKRALAGLAYPPSLWCPVWMSTLFPDELDSLFGKKIDIEDVYSEAIEAWESCPQENLVDKVSQFYVKLYLQNGILVKVDRASMLHGLEVRAPFLDTDFVDFVRRLPWQFKYRNGNRKHLLKRAATGLIPDRIIHRPKKGFGVPVGRWFHDKKLVVNPAASPAPLDRDFIANTAAAHVAGKSDHRLFLWNYWLLTHMAAGSTASPER